jgi:hypothetical protein
VTPASQSNPVPEIAWTVPANDKTVMKVFSSFQQFVAHLHTETAPQVSANWPSGMSPSPVFRI